MVPQIAQAIRLQVTPGMKVAISIMALEVLKSEDFEPAVSRALRKEKTW